MLTVSYTKYAAEMVGKIALLDMIVPGKRLVCGLDRGFGRPLAIKEHNTLLLEAEVLWHRAPSLKKLIQRPGVLARR